MKKSDSHHHIIKQVPPDYYQNGIKTNFLQRKWRTKKLQIVFDLIVERPRSILDVGCASGWFLAEVSKKYKHADFYGIDIYGDAIYYAQKKYKKINFSVADAHYIPFSKNSFDLVICTEVMEHVDYPGSVLSEIHRVLKKEGKAIIELDSGSILFSIAWFLWRLGKGKVWKDAHTTGFNLKKLEKLFKKNGLVMQKKRTFNVGMAVVYVLTKA